MPASSIRITGISSMATRDILAQLSADYTRLSGPAVAIESVGGVEAARRVQAGEVFDIAVLASDAIDQLIAAGHLVAGSSVGLACSGMALAVAAGAPRPDISSADAVRDAVLAARSIGYSTGPSGKYLLQLFAQWGIAERIAGRLVQASPGSPVAALVARGDAELGFQQLSEMMHAPGIEVLGPLPPAIQLVTRFSAAICSRSGQHTAAQALLQFMASQQTASIKRQHGMEPA